MFSPWPRGKRHMCQTFAMAEEKEKIKHSIANKLWSCCLSNTSFFQVLYHLFFIYAPLFLQGMHNSRSLRRLSSVCWETKWRDTFWQFWPSRMLTIAGFTKALFWPQNWPFIFSWSTSNTNSVSLCTTLLPAKVRGYPNICHWVHRRGPSGGWETIASNEGPRQKRTKTPNTCSAWA